MKTKEEPNALTEEELRQVSGGKMPAVFGAARAYRTLMSLIELGNAEMARMLYDSCQKS